MQLDYKYRFALTNPEFFFWKWNKMLHSQKYTYEFFWGITDIQQVPLRRPQ